MIKHLRVRTRASRIILAAAFAVVVWLVATASASANGSYLYMRGDDGDWLAGPHTYWYTNADAAFSASYGFDGCTSGVRCTTMMASLDTPGYAHWWNVWLSPLLGQPLVPGTYQNAQRSDFRDSTHPGMDVFGDGRGCNTVSGDFTVYSASFTGSTVNQFRAAFTDHCEGGTPAVRGEIGINVPLPPAPATGKVLLNAGAPATNSTAASLTASGKRISEIRYATDGALDSEQFQPYNGAIPVTLPAGDGPKSVIAQFKNSVGFVSDFVSDSILLDTVAPTGMNFVSPAPLAIVTANPFNVGWTASDTGSGIGGYTVTYTRAPYNGSFGPPMPWLTNIQSTHASFTPVAGSQYCLYAKAKDKAGNESPQARVCVTAPLDDASLSVGSGSWTRVSDAGYYLGMYSLSASAGDALVSPTVQARRIGVVYAKCATCGTIEIRFNGAVLGTIDTHAPSTTLQASSYLPALPAITTGVVEIRAAGANPVRVDGVAISRS